MRAKIFGFAALVAVLVVAVVEVGAYLTVDHLAVNPRTRSLIYRPPVITEEVYRDYLTARDPDLGWPARTDLGGAVYDRDGARPDPSFGPDQPSCISVYGDSFVYSVDVGPADAWAAQLSARLGCRVANFGVSGYGTDQAVLRFERNRDDHAPISILGIYPTNALRNLTRYSYSLIGEPLAFKPRFRLDGDRLALVPLPEIAPADLPAYLRDPAGQLDHDAWLRDAGYGAVGVGFPYLLTTIRLAGHERLGAWLAGRPSWASFLAPGHRSQGFELMTALIARFVERCGDRDRRCLVLLFPTRRSLANHVAGTPTGLGPLIEWLDVRGIDHIDLADALAVRLAGRSYCELRADPANCAGHHNPAGEAMIADVVQEHLDGPDLRARLPVAVTE